MGSADTFLRQVGSIGQGMGVTVKHLKGALVAITAAMLAACTAPSSSEIKGPSGQTVRTTKCSASPDKCLAEAAARCSGPYQVLDSSSNAGGLAADLLPGPVTWYRMTYQCGKSDGVMPTFPFRGQQYTPRPGPRYTNCNSVGSTISCTSY